MTFKQAVLQNKAKLSDVDDWIDKWHDNNFPKGMKLYEHLGLTFQEYCLFVESPRYLKEIIGT